MKVFVGQLFRVEGSKPLRFVKVLYVGDKMAKIRTVTSDGKYSKGRAPIRQAQLSRFGVDASPGNYTFVS